MGEYSRFTHNKSWLVLKDSKLFHTIFADQIEGSQFKVDLVYDSYVL